MGTTVFAENVNPHHRKRGEVSSGIAGNDKRYEVISKEMTSFLILLAIYFPSVTGILTGSNLSG